MSDEASSASGTLAQRIVGKIFAEKFQPGLDEVPFTRDEIIAAAADLGEKRPKNVGDVVYSLKYRTPLPASILEAAPSGLDWAIFPGGNAVYVLRLVPVNVIEPRQGLTMVKIPDATPGVISMYSMSDEQALLARVRYNRLLDVFTGLTCYPLQSHLRTTIEIDDVISGEPSSSQVETDELYVGVDTHGAHFVLPVQAKGGTDVLSVIQIWQDFRVAEQKFTELQPRPIAAQFMQDDDIALFEFAERDGEITIARERHYRLVDADQLSPDDLQSYRAASELDTH
ncbi:endonuclease [Candidatus Poriferisodalis sp.]|uniref:endonuclease n=1 Tax=Candidatus Poriferisodalis sp. TaxID=3101277 RepID=UPI003B59C79D